MVLRGLKDFFWRAYEDMRRQMNGKKKKNVVRYSFIKCTYTLSQRYIGDYKKKVKKNKINR